MDLPLTTYRNLFKDASLIIKHQKEIAILKGENFNIFSILKMEYRENETHSALLGEILKPNGSHGLGSVFLKCFLELLNIHTHIDISSAKVILEKHLSSRNTLEVSGGRVDIFIIDDNGNTICIENKIHASDQELQIARYCNYNPGKNLVYYLTLEGEDPAKNSFADKIIDKDFFKISYKSEIIDWLEQCQKEATQFPILRESINQYALLLKKLTNQLSDYKMEQEIKDLIAANYEAASAIDGNVRPLELEYAEKLISEVVLKLRNSLSENFEVKYDENLNKPQTGISIRNIHWPNGISVNLEGNSKIPWNTSGYGVVADKNKFDRLKIKEVMNPLLDQSGFSETELWPYYRNILDFSTVDKRARLFNTKERAELVKELSERLKELSIRCEKPFSSHNFV